MPVCRTVLAPTKYLVCFDLPLAATHAVINRHQLAFFHVKLFVLVHRPFVMPVTTQGITLVLFFQRRFAKRYDLSHGYAPRRLQQRAMQRRIPGCLTLAPCSGGDLDDELVLGFPDVLHLCRTVP